MHMELPIEEFRLREFEQSTGVRRFEGGFVYNDRNRKAKY